ncbi:enoyl-(acyl carrier) reductase, partial [Trifolium pratense]
GNVSSPLELSEEEWNKVFKTNITGTWLVSKYVCKLMCDAKRKGSIINISSIAGLERGQLPGATAYACSKAGVNMLTKMLKDQLTLDRKGFRSRSSRTCSEVSLGFDWCSDIPNRCGSKLSYRRSKSVMVFSWLLIYTYRKHIADNELLRSIKCNLSSTLVGRVKCGVKVTCVVVQCPMCRFNSMRLPLTVQQWYENPVDGGAISEWRRIVDKRDLHLRRDVEVYRV